MNNLKMVAKQALSLMDLTTLNDNDSNDIVTELCHKAKTTEGYPAAICIYPQFIPAAKMALKQLKLNEVKIATVTNFPHGNDDISLAVKETQQAIELGADEVDVVFPYRALISGNESVGFELVKQCKQVCGDNCLKVIIEVGELKEETLIKKASGIAIDAGADFIKTSTGKVSVNATPEYALMMLDVIEEKSVQHRVGFKVAGGVRTAEDAQIYIEMAKKKFGESWISSKHFRFGASSLLGNLIDILSGKCSEKDDSSY